MSSRAIHWVLGLLATGYLLFLSVAVGQAARTSPGRPALFEYPSRIGVGADPVRAAGADGTSPDVYTGGQDPAGQAAAQPAYVGEETCLGCHADYTRGYGDSAHGRAANPRSPRALRGCESCHGPGGAHVEDPAANPMFRFASVEPERASEACLTCHRRGEHALWEGSAHEARNMSCISCHSVHAARSPQAGPSTGAIGVGAVSSSGEGTGQSQLAMLAQGTNAQLVAASEMELCAQCHRDKVVKLDRSGHMPVREGKMTCSTCHNPHGATNERALRHGTTPTESCATCHADKRGPFLWEHAPVTESCATCHDPHGSANERMLVAKLPMLCQRCHIHTRHPSTIYDASLMGTSNRLYGRSCVTCHSNIHGSNHASGNMFVR